MRRRSPQNQMTNDCLRSDVLVHFGASSDLAYKQIFLARKPLIRCRHVAVSGVGVARSPLESRSVPPKAKILHDRVVARHQTASLSSRVDALSPNRIHAGRESVEPLFSTPVTPQCPKHLAILVERYG